MELPRLETLDIKGKRVLVRADLNVPLKDGVIEDDSRIAAALPTYRAILDRGGRLVLIAHLDRPGGERDPASSLQPVADALGKALGGVEVGFADDCVGETAQAAVSNLADGACVLLENLRFHGGEKANDADFADALAGLADVYVNDAFSAAHREHASIVGPPQRMPAAVGLLMERELGNLERLLSHPARPYTALLGGAKAETKIPVVEHFLSRGDQIMLGGVMATTFLAARGLEVGRSKIGEDDVDTAKRLLDDADSGGSAELMLPVDVVVAPEMQAGAEASVVDAAGVPPDMMILDIGPETIRRYTGAIGEAGSVVWNGTLGAAEHEPFRRGSHLLAAAVAERTQAGDLVSVAGGGDTAAFLNRHNILHMFTYVSMAGGAFLHWLSGDPLPGIEALRRAN